MASDPFTLTTEMVVASCQPTQGGEQALQRIRMEHHYGKGPFVGRADHDATVAESLHYVDVFWDAWGQAYLTSVLGRFGVRDPEGVTVEIDANRTHNPDPDDLVAHTDTAVTGDD